MRFFFFKFAKFTRTIIGETVSSIGRAPELYSEGYEFDSRTDSLAFCFTQINRKVWIRVNNLLQHAQHFYKKNASTILSCVGGAGVVVTTITAIKATPKPCTNIYAINAYTNEYTTFPLSLLHPCNIPKYPH